MGWATSDGAVHVEPWGYRVYTPTVHQLLRKVNDKYNIERIFRWLEGVNCITKIFYQPRILSDQTGLVGKQVRTKKALIRLSLALSSKPRTIYTYTIYVNIEFHMMVHTESTTQMSCNTSLESQQTSLESVFGCNRNSCYSYHWIVSTDSPLLAWTIHHYVLLDSPSFHVEHSVLTQQNHHMHAWFCKSHKNVILTPKIMR